MENNNRDDTGQSQINSTDLLKKRVIDWIFETARLGCHKQDAIAEYTYETDFTRAVGFAHTMLLKKSPPQIRKVIKQLYSNMDAEITKINNDTGLNDPNKMMTKQKIAFDTSCQVLEILFPVLNNSDLSSEFCEMQVKDFEALIKKIRVPNALQLFSGDIDDAE